MEMAPNGFGGLCRLNSNQGNSLRLENLTINVVSKFTQYRKNVF